MQNAKRHSVYFLLLPDTLLIDMAGPADALLFANRYQQEVHFDLKFISPFPQIRTSVGLQLGELAPLPQQLEADAILILPGLVGMEFRYDTPEEQATIQWLRRQVTPGNRLICICSGALLAAHAGLLSNHAATTHHDHCKDLAQIDSSIRVEENRIFVEQGMISTSAGVTAGIDLALHLISQLAGPLTAAAVARNMVVYMRRAGTDPQLSPWVMHRNHIHPVVHKVQDAVTRNPTHPWSLPELAGIACTSSRHLTRLFKTHAGVSVQEYLTSLRLSLAGKLLAQTGWSMDRVAEAAGFGSVRQFRRIWSHFHDASPKAYRVPQERIPH
ncbi:GlxA family transcriptional regulator [Undibacterium sp.]|jgi:transcriptional regulator GlxA family with amidase domain|uniref:GlxA family transcriptional regulator n=1 Tax=Undibacterium sp. TaxID=1914977 RepID=UPI002BD66FDD|nr:helix-turn-helix domain-containing protein [Undibacterium sp.]HTD07114.1 helix-turn-helix domain-containing protein [Undibacterium sp.]